MGITKITRNYQVTLPKDVREVSQLSVGDKVLVLAAGGKIELICMKKGIIEKAAGLWKNLDETGVEYERRLRKKWKKRKIY